MSKRSTKTDIFAHILPSDYKNFLIEALPANNRSHESLNNPVMSDLEKRFEIMDQFEGLRQVLSIPPPPVELISAPDKALELARIANDGLAELVTKYPERFTAAVACLPMNSVKNSLLELDRAINDLKLKGFQIYCPIEDKPLDSVEFFPIYEKMVKFDLPILLHPYRSMTSPDYKTESNSKYLMFHIFGWPYETSTAMGRLVFSGVMEKFSGLKIICHHNGGMIPFFESRIIDQQYRPQMKKAEFAELAKPPLDYFKLFFVDTVTRSIPALMCTYHFFGARHMIFGTDMPYGIQNGLHSIREGIKGIEGMEISSSERQMIFETNLRNLLHLPKREKSY